MDQNTYNQLHRNLQSLEPEQQLIIHLRFWENFSISEVARVLRVSWEEADRLIEMTLLELRLRLTLTNQPARRAA